MCLLLSGSKPLPSILIVTVAILTDVFLYPFHIFISFVSFHHSAFPFCLHLSLFGLFILCHYPSVQYAHHITSHHSVKNHLSVWSVVLVLKTNVWHCFCRLASVQEQRLPPSATPDSRLSPTMGLGGDSDTPITPPAHGKVSLCLYSCLPFSSL